MVSKFTQITAKYQTIMNIDSQLLTIIESLEDSVRECNKVKDDPKKGYPYVSGYSLSTMDYAIGELKNVVEQYRSIIQEEECMS